jgi:hypothetical protein
VCVRKKDRTSLPFFFPFSATDRSCLRHCRPRSPLNGRTECGVCVSSSQIATPRPRYPGDRHGPTRPTDVALGIATSGPQTDATGRTSSGRTRDLRERSRVLGEVRWGSGRPMGSTRRPPSRCRRGTSVITISWATHICFALTPSVVAHYNRLARARSQVAVMPRGSPCTT